MLPGWDKMQDLRGFIGPKQKEKPDITQAIADAADRVTAYRVIKYAKGSPQMSLLGKMQHLTETAQDFHNETEAVLDGIAAKIELAKERRETAKDKHHGYYDAIIKGVDDSVTVIDRLSNGPLPDGGGN
jgi:hypothetical protein